MDEKEELLEAYRKINKLEIQLEATNKENDYMKENIRNLNHMLNKIKKSRVYKFSKIVKKVKRKMAFWRK